jgi:hypothetical protein
MLGCILPFVLADIAKAAPSLYSNTVVGQYKKSLHHGGKTMGERRYGRKHSQVVHVYRLVIANFQNGARAFSNSQAFESPRVGK